MKTYRQFDTAATGPARAGYSRGPRAALLLLAMLALETATPAPFIVTTTNDTGAGSLRAAITSANGTGGGTNLIQFAVTNPPAGVRTITPPRHCHRSPGQSSLTVT